MELSTLILSVIVGAVILFFWTGFAQNVLPWGVRSVKQHHEGTIGHKIGAVTNDGMVYIKSHVAAFVAVKPESYYSMTHYFAIELLTQGGVAAVLTLILALTDPLATGERLAVVGLCGLAGVLSIDLQYWNWWGFSTWYTVGVAINRLAGYLLAAFVLLNWVV